jgi:peptide/nickel transport system substrate-binding protein
MRENYWSRRSLSRRKLLGSAAAGATGVAALATVGCGGDDDGGAAPTIDLTGGSTSPTAQTSQVDLTATLKAGISADLGNLDPQSVAGVANIPNVITHFDTLFGTDADKNIIPQMASFKWINNNTALELKVTPGITFHNGEEWNADAIKFNLDRALERTTYHGNSGFKSGRKTILAPSITGDIVVVDPMTVRIECKPDVGLPGNIQPAILMVPPKYVQQVGDEEFARKPVGSGPFSFVSRTADTEYKSARFDKYFHNRESGLRPRLPYVANLSQLIRPDDQARLAALEAGEIDIAWDVNPELGKTFANKSGFAVKYIQDGTGVHIQFNNQVPTDPVTGGPNPWKDIRVRKAANLAIDVKTIIQKLGTGQEKLSYGFSSENFGYPKDIEKKPIFGYDPTQAKALLAQAGFSSITTDMYIGTGRVTATSELALAVQSYLAAVGIKVNIKSQSFNDLLPFQRDHKIPGLFMFVVNNAAEPNSTMAAELKTGGVYTKSSYPELDAMYDDQSAEFDPVKRKEKLGKLWNAWYDNASWIFLYESVRTGVMKTKLDWKPESLVTSHAEYWNIKVLKG